MSGDVNTDKTDDVLLDADALYRQGMAYYRARQWPEARDCFLRLRAAEPDRRGVDGLINELDHFIRLEEVRPSGGASATLDRQPDGRSSPASRAWLFAIPALIALMLLGAVAMAGSGMFAQGAAPSPSAAVQAHLLTARVASAPVQVAAGGTGPWQEWSNGRLLAERDQIRLGPQGVIELTLADGKVTLHALSDATLTVSRLSANGEAHMLQTDGDVRVQAGSRLFYLDTPALAAQCLEAGSIYRAQASGAQSRLMSERGQVLVTAGDRSLVLGQGETAEAAPGQPVSVQRPAMSTPAPTTAPVSTPAATNTTTSTATPPPTVTTTATATPLPATPALSLPTATPTVGPALPTATRTPNAPEPPTRVPAPTDTPAPPTETPVPPTHTPAPPTPTRKR